MAKRDEYAAAGVPMLPVTAGNAFAARVILSHTLSLVALSLVIAWLGLGWIYAVPAAIGGAIFVWCSILLVRRPSPATAMANFHASLLQLSLMLLGAIADRALGG